jgi:hypothetical protein
MDSFLGAQLRDEIKRARGGAAADIFGRVVDEL